MRRREFIAGLGGAVTWPMAAQAQQAALPVVGFVTGGSADAFADRARAFRKGLSETGYIEDQNLTVEYHWLEGQYDRLPALMADLVRRRVSVIATPDNVVTLAAKAATATIPIVFSVAEDPVKLGLVASLARPGGNATGINFFSAEVVVVAKRLELLHALVPKAVRVAVLVNPANARNAETTLRSVQEAAPVIKLQIQVLNASTTSESMRPLPLSREKGPTSSSSLPTHSSSAGACNLLPWRHATGFRRLIRRANLLQPAG
jgi:putative ABC transport system substrate-binding protein